MTPSSSPTLRTKIALLLVAASVLYVGCDVSSDEVDDSAGGGGIDTFIPYTKTWNEAECVSNSEVRYTNEDGTFEFGWGGTSCVITLNSLYDKDALELKVVKAFGYHPSSPGGQLYGAYLTLRAERDRGAYEWVSRGWEVTVEPGGSEGGRGTSNVDGLNIAVNVNTIDDPPSGSATVSASLPEMLVNLPYYGDVMLSATLMTSAVTAGGSNQGGSGEPPDPARCNALANQCAQGGQAACYCAAACVYALNGEHAAEANERLKAQALGTICQY